MTCARPNALSLAVAVAISSSITVTQVLADRRLLTKSVDIQSNGQAVYILSEVVVQPTLGDNQQPIPKSITTTYPDQTEVNAGYDVPSEGFTDVLSGIGGGVSMVDQFETSKDDVARKYTKVLKVGNEGVFKFTQNLAEKVLVIEVRDGMIHQNSIAAVRAQSGDVQPLEPLTKIANPEHLAGVLKGAHERAGNLGEADNYVVLATIEVDEVEVRGRTFMRLIASGDQPPELRRLGQSLFVNDEVLLAAATSAYTQVHVLGEDLQQQALNDLLSYHQPVGYVVHVRDERQAYPMPVGYPKLEVTEARGEIIVFRGQKQNPTDIAFVERLNSFQEENNPNNPTPAVAQVKKDKVKSYQYVIRSRQMALLEGFAERLDCCRGAGLGTLELSALADYESIQQALTIASSDQADEFDFTIGHIRVASSFFTPTLFHNQLEKHFSFKPVLRNLLANPIFIKNIQPVILSMSDTSQTKAKTSEHDEAFISNVMRETSRKLIEVETQLIAQEANERELIQLRNLLKLTSEEANCSEKENPIALLFCQEYENQLANTRIVIVRMQNQLEKLKQEVKRIPKLQPMSDAREESRKAYNTQRAANLGIVDWDDTQPLGEQLRRIEKKIHQIHQMTVATIIAKGKPLQQKADPIAEEIRLASIENQLGLIPNNENDLEARHKAILQLFKPHAPEVVYPPAQHLQEQAVKRISELEQQFRDARADATKVRNTQIAAELGIDDWDDTQPPEEQASLIRHEIKQLVAATGQPVEEAVKAKPAAIGGKRDITSINEGDPDILQPIKRHLQQKEELTDRLIQNNMALIDYRFGIITEDASDRIIQNNLAYIEGQLGLVPVDEKDPGMRCRTIQQHIRTQDAQIEKELAERSHWIQNLQKEVDRTPILKKEVREAIAATSISATPVTATPVTATPVTATPVTATSITRSGQPGEEALKEKLAATVSKQGITPVNENKLDTCCRNIQHHLQQKAELTDRLMQNILANTEGQSGLVPDNEKNPEVRCQNIQQHLKLREVQIDQQYLQQQSTRTDAKNEPDIKARYATIAAHLNIQNFDSNADIDAQQERLIKKLKKINAQGQRLRQKLYKMRKQRDMEHSYTRLRKNAVAAILDIKLSEDTTLEDRDTLESTVHAKLFKLKELEKQLHDIQTPGHPKAMPEVLETLSAVEKALEMSDVDENDGVYLRREDISDSMQAFITKASERAEEEALEILSATEQVFNIKINRGDNKAARLARVRTRLDADDVPEYMLDKIYNIVTQENRRLEYMKSLKPESPLTDITLSYPKKGSPEWLSILRRRLTYKVEEVDEQASEKQTGYLAAIEDKLRIYPHENVAARERSMAFTAELASKLQVAFEKDATLPDRKYALRVKISELLDEVSKDCDEEVARRAWNNEMAHQLNIGDYKDDATIDDQNSLIEKKLQALDEEVFNAGQPDINERIAVIENELDRQVARLGPKPRYVLDREVARARRVVAEAESELASVHHQLNTLRGKGHEKLRARAGLNIQGDDLGTEEEADYFISNAAFKDRQGQDEFDEALGELPLTRKKYAQVTEFLHEHDMKSIDLTCAMADEDLAEAALICKIHENIFSTIDDLAEPLPGQITELFLALRHKREAVSNAKQDLADYQALIGATEKAVGIKPAPADNYEHRVNALRNRQLQLGGNDATGGDIGRLTQEQARLESEIETRKADIERMKELRKAAEKSVENDGGPFQFTPRQVKVLTDIRDFMQQHSLKKQALEAAMGLAELAVESGKAMPCFTTFDFDDELAPVRLRTLVGESLTFDQANRIVKVFKRLKTIFPLPSSEPVEGQPLNVLAKVQRLVFRARNQLQNGAQEYDEVIYGMGKTATHYVEHEPEDLKSFSEFVTTHFASGHKIIALMREGLISKTEIEHYMKAVRGVDGYQTVDEF
ncbi:hypothetical protein, partial [Endozoicomonas sp. SESOKO3]|uniref:hypothetical protein n=1 Tax=Endozoicomonas sp. SESOKO3 TaxID=2828744 RepID=UPI0021481422